MYKMITTGLLCIAAVALKAQDAPIDSVDHTKSNTLGASSTVYTNDLVKYQSATILTGLQGRLKGLNVSPFRGMQLLRTEANTKSDIVGAIPNVGGGIYGDNSEFLISARGQSPIAIVDGVERDLYSIDPEAIESVTIQKDAQYDTYHYFKDYHRELQTICANVDNILGTEREVQRKQQQSRKNEHSL